MADVFNVLYRLFDKLCISLKGLTHNQIRISPFALASKKNSRFLVNDKNNRHNFLLQINVIVNFQYIPFCGILNILKIFTFKKSQCNLINHSYVELPLFTCFALLVVYNNAKA